MTKQLPPDPEQMNDDRAAWAEQAVAAFIKATGTDRCDALPDLLADLLHWCDRHDCDFDTALTRGRDQYEAETVSDLVTPLDESAGLSHAADQGERLRTYRVQVLVKTLETYEVEAASAEEAEENFGEGRLTGTDDALDNDIIAVEEV